MCPEHQCGCSYNCSHTQLVSRCDVAPFRLSLCTHAFERPPFLLRPPDHLGFFFCCLQADWPSLKRPCDGLMMFSFHHPGARLHLCPLSSYCIRFHRPSLSLSLSIPLSIHLSSTIIFCFSFPPFPILSAFFPHSSSSLFRLFIFLFNSLFLLDVPRPFLPTFN